MAAERGEHRLHSKKYSPDILKELGKPERKLVARMPLLAREPLTPLKVVIAGEGGVLAAILPAGMRAISTRIKEETGVGRLILPNDRVDVIHTRTRAAERAIRSLGDALSQRTRARHRPAHRSQGRQEARRGNTATLELTPAQAQRLAEANSGGEISLSCAASPTWRPRTVRRQPGAAIPSGSSSME
jgi:pilus assembly protein CpaB